MEIFLASASAMGTIAAMLFSYTTAVKSRKSYVYLLGIAVAILTTVISVLRACTTDDPTIAGSTMVSAIATTIFAVQIYNHQSLAKFEEELGLNL